MLAHFRTRLTYANVISTLCLFMLLGGGAYAAALAAKNSVNSKAIINGQVKKPDLAGNAVTAAKLGRNSVTESKIGPGQVSTRNLEAAQAWQAVRGNPSPGGFCATAVQDGVFECSSDGVVAWRNDQAGFNNDAGYYKDPYGVVHLKGIVTNGCISGHCSIDTRDHIFKLPAGYKPSKEWSFETGTGYGPGLIAVQADGQVVAVTGDSRGVSLDGISFRACNEPGSERC